MLSLLLALALAPAPDARVQADDPHLSLCRTHYGLEEWDDAVSECEQAVKQSPSSIHHDWLARAYGAKAEHSAWFQAIALAKKVRSEFESAVAADPRDAVSRRDLAEYYIEAPGFLGGSKQKAAEQADALEPLHKPSALYIRARLAESNKDNETAEKLYQQAVAAASEPGEPIAELASFYRRTGDLDKMQATVARLSNTSGTPLFDGAALLVRTNRQLPTAVSMLERYIAQGGTPDAPVYQAYYQLGLAYQKMGDKAAAKSRFQQATQIARYAPAEKALSKLE